MNASPNLEPDRDAMWRHITTLFGGDFEEAADGLVELAWTDAEPPHKLGHGQQFGTDELEQLVDRAFELNRRPCVNVYVGAALRKPDTPRNARAKDSHFLCAPFDWYDHDEDGARAAVEESKKRGVPATITVVTGRHPILRLHLYWRLVEACRDPMLMRALCVATAKALGGDTSVVNPSRIMRIGGSLAWPTKPGRILELTEVHIPDDGRPNAYWFATLMERFGDGMPLAAPTPPALPKPASEVAPEVQPEKPDGAKAAEPTPDFEYGIDPEPRSIPGLAIGSHLVEALLGAVRAGRHWHNNAVRLVGHWIARGWSDAEILTAAEALTLSGYTVAQTRREVAAMIEGGRRKWGIANPEHELGSEDVERQQVIDPRAWAGKPVPQREWLVENWIPMLKVTALYGDGGLGKTLLAQQLLTSVAAGREWLGLPVKRLRAFGLLCEDDEDDLHLNQERINRACWLDYKDLGDLRLWPSVGFDNLLMTFDGKDAAKGNLTTFFGQLLHAIQEFGARFVVLDTAADLFGGNENIRSQVRQFIANACGRIARKTNGAVLLCAHPSLSGMATGAGSSGSTAWSNTVRSRLYLTPAKAEESQDPDPDLRRLTRKKSNYARAGETLMLRWSDGVMTPVAAGSESDDPDIRGRVLAEVDRAWREGQPYSDSPQARARYVLAHLPRRVGLSRGAVERAYLTLLTSGEIRVDWYDRHRNLRGLRAVHPPGGSP